MKDMKQIVGENLSELRKSKKLTQFEIAEAFNYSDKAVSKWENGDTLPDFETLNNLAIFYGVTLDYLTHPASENKEKYMVDNKQQRYNHIAICGLLISAWWIIATIAFVYSLIVNGHGYWIAFLWALLPSAVTINFFNKKWFDSNKTIYIVSWSIFTWFLLLSMFFQFIEMKMWPLFLVGIPIEIAIFLWSTIKK